MMGWMKHNLESRLSGQISITSDAQMTDTTIMTESKEELKRILMKVIEETKKPGLKLNIQQRNSVKQLSFNKKTKNKQTKNSAFRK